MSAGSASSSRAGAPACPRRRADRRSRRDGRGATHVVHLPGGRAGRRPLRLDRPEHAALADPPHRAGTSPRSPCPTAAGSGGRGAPASAASRSWARPISLGRRARTAEPEAAVRPRVVADLVALGGDAPHDAREPARPARRRGRTWRGRCWRASRSSTRGVHAGSGPSSKVRPMRRSPRGPRQTQRRREQVGQPRPADPGGGAEPERAADHERSRRRSSTAVDDALGRVGMADAPHALAQVLEQLRLVEARARAGGPARAWSARPARCRPAPRSARCGAPAPAASRRAASAARRRSPRPGVIPPALVTSRSAAAMSERTSGTKPRTRTPVPAVCRARIFGERGVASGDEHAPGPGGPAASAPTPRRAGGPRCRSSRPSPAPPAGARVSPSARRAAAPSMAASNSARTGTPVTTTRSRGMPRATNS